MPWAETSAVQERIRSIADYESRLYTMIELCQRFGVSRQTGYKWIHRFREQGAAGLEDRSRVRTTARTKCRRRRSRRSSQPVAVILRADHASCWLELAGETPGRRTTEPAPGPKLALLLSAHDRGSLQPLPGGTAGTRRRGLGRRLTVSVSVRGVRNRGRNRAWEASSHLGEGMTHLRGPGRGGGPKPGAPQWGDSPSCRLL